MSVLSYNQIIDLFTAISQAHYQIKRFGTGELSEADLNKFISENPQYPVFWATPVNVSSAPNTIQYSFNLLFFDIVNKDKNNEQEVLSDTLQIALDVYRILKLENDEFGVVGDPTISPFAGRYSEWVAGWSMEVVIEVIFQDNLCDIPYEGLNLTQILQNFTGGGIDGFGCDDLGTCIDFINLQNSVSIALAEVITGGTYFSGTSTLELYNQSGGTIQITGITSGSGSQFNCNDLLNCAVITGLTGDVQTLQSQITTALSGGSFSAGTLTFNTIGNTTIDITGLTDGMLISTDQGNSTILGTDDGIYTPYSKQETSGILLGGEIQPGNTSSRFTVRAGAGQLVNFSQNGNDVLVEKQIIVWNSFDNLTPQFLNTDPFTYLMIDSGGNLIESNTPPVEADYKTNIIIGVLCHIDLTIINLITNTQNVSFNTPHRFLDLLLTIGPIKKTGLTLTGTNGAGFLDIDRSSGEAFKIGINYVNDNNEADIIQVGQALSTLMCRLYRDGSGGYIYDDNAGSKYNELRADRYDDGSGTLQVVNNNQWSIQRAYLFPNNPDDLIVYYGQTVYNQKAHALDNLFFESFSEAEITTLNAVFVGYIVIRGGAQNTADTDDCVFIQGGLFRGLGGGGASGTQVISLDDLSDVVLSSPTYGQSLVYNGTEWVNSYSLTADTFNISNTPTLNNSPTQILSRNSSTGEIEYTEPSQYLNEASTDQIYGSGFDGDVVMDGTNTFAAFTTKVGSAYTLTRTIYTNNLTITNNATLNPNGFGIYVKGTLTFGDFNCGIISNGNNGGNGTSAGAVGAGATSRAAAATNYIIMNCGGAGGAGGGTSANAGNITVGVNYVGGIGGSGGFGYPTGNSGVGTTTTRGTVTVTAGILQQPYSNNYLSHSLYFGSVQMFASHSAAGGQCGINAGGGTQGTGGGGGGATRGIAIFANNIDMTVGGASGNIQSQGGNGGTGGNGGGINSTGGGGGGGGGGGFIYIITNNLSYISNNRIRATGGTGGLGGTGSGTVNGQSVAGVRSQSGSNGVDGYIVIINPVSGTNTVYTGLY